MRSILLCSLLVSLLRAGVGQAQELPPAGGWPPHPVTALRAVAEPPGGLVPYRQGQLWGFADTTGRVWIRPVFKFEPPRFGAGLLLLSEQKAAKVYRPRRVFRRVAVAGSHRSRRKGKAHYSRETRDQSFTMSSNERYGQWHSAADGALVWALPLEKLPQLGPTWVLNARGEQLLVRPNEAIAQAADGSWRAVSRRGAALTQPELVAIAPHELESGALRPGRLFTVPLGRRAPAPPPRLTRRRSYDPDADFTASFAGTPPLYLAQKVNWLRPTRQVLRNGRCGDRFEDTDTRYRHQGQFALFDERGHRLTDYRYAGMKRLTPNRLAYWHWTGDQYEDEQAADSSGLPNGYDVREDFNGPARRYGLLDRRGHELTPPLFVRMQAAGPSSVWVVAVRGGRLHYGLLDTLGRYQLPLSPSPISLPDAAGLLRRYSTAPLPAVESPETSQRERRYPDTTTVQYLHPDGSPAFAGRFDQADAFWHGRALVRQHGLYGLLDTLGRWVLPPQPDEHNQFAYDRAHHDQWAATDPLGLFDHLDGEGGQRWGSWNGTRPGDPPLLLAHGPQGYGLRDGRTGQVVVPAVFDRWPEQWYGGVVGQRLGQPLGYSYRGQSFRPHVPATIPAEVRQPTLTDHLRYRPLLQRTEQGWLTRGGRQLWQD